MLTKKGYVLQKKDLSFSKIQEIKQSLTVSPFNPFSQFPEKFPVYQETEQVLRIPRFYGIKELGSPKTNKQPSGIPIDVTFQGSLKEELCQPEAVEKTLKQIYDVGGALLSLPTGYGKTSCALYILSKISKKTLIIVHKSVLMDQWKERIQQFLPMATVGIVKQNTVQVVGKDIVIAMLQSVSLKDYGLEKENFGLVIIDETHHICSKLFSQSMFRLCPKYILGLSATPTRKDGLTKVLYWFLHDISYYLERNVQDNCIVCVHKRDASYDLLETNLTKLVSEMIVDEERNEFILSQIKIYSSEQRNILLLSDRRSHCEYLCNEINKKTNIKAGLYLGGMKKKELEYNEINCNVLFATYQLAAEGLDIPKLDTLILATPKGDVVQACGRILRETPGKQNNPVIVDIVDDHPSLIKMYRKRNQFYKKTFRVDLISQ